MKNFYINLNQIKSNPDGEPTVNRQSRLMSHQGKAFRNVQMSRHCPQPDSVSNPCRCRDLATPRVFSADFYARAWKHVAMIFSVLVMSIANIATAWGTDIDINIDQLRSLPTRSALVKISNVENCTISSGKLQIDVSNPGTFTIASNIPATYKIKSVSISLKYSRTIDKFSSDQGSFSGTDKAWTFTPTGGTPIGSATITLDNSGAKGSNQISFVVTVTTAEDVVVEELSSFTLDGDWSFITSKAPSSTQVNITTSGTAGISADNGIKISSSSSKTGIVNVSLKDGYNLKFISLYYYNITSDIAVSASTGTYTATTYTWIPSETSTEVSLSYVKPSESIRIYKIYVGYEAAAPACSAPSSVTVSSPLGSTGWAYIKGETIQMHANVTGGSGTPHYTWQKQISSVWTDIDGAPDDDDYEIEDCTAENAGSYRCVVSTGESCSTASSQFDVKVFRVQTLLGGVYTFHDLTTIDREEGYVQGYIYLQENSDYAFKVHDGHDGWGNNTETQMSSSNNSNWALYTNHANYLGLRTNYTDNYLFTWKFASASNNQTVSVTYPTHNQTADKTIYFDNSKTNWSNIYYRIGNAGHNENSGMISKNDVIKVAGTANFYQLTTWAYNNFLAWHFADNISWSGDKNSIYKTDGTGYVINNHTAWQKYVVSSTITLSPTTNDGGTPKVWSVDKTTGMKTYTVTSSATNCTITLEKCTNYGSGTYTALSSGGTVMPTQYVKVTVTPSTGHEWNSFSVSGTEGTDYDVVTAAAAGTPGVYIIMGDVTFTASCSVSTYDITYHDGKGMSFSGSHADGHPTTHTYGTATDLKTATKSGYVFGGWYDNNSFTGDPVTSLGATTYTDDIDLYAKWEKDVYLNLNGKWSTDSKYFAVYCWNNSSSENTWVWLELAEVCSSPAVYKATIPSNYYDRIIFVHKNSNTLATWDNKDHQSADLEFPGSKDQYTLSSANGGDGGKAEGSWASNYSAPTWTISFAGNDNTGGSMSNISSIACDANQTITANAFTKTGYNFAGWKANVDVKVNDETVTAGSIIANSATIQNVRSNITLTAQWSQIMVSSITLDLTSKTLTVDGTQTITPTVLPATALDKTITWTTSDADVATVDGGVVTAVGVGSATITATAHDGSGIYAECAITVEEAASCSGDPTALVSGTLYKVEDMASACAAELYGTGQYKYGLSTNGKFYVVGTTDDNNSSTGTVEMKTGDNLTDVGGDADADFTNYAWLKMAGSTSHHSIKFVVPSGGGKLIVYGKGGGTGSGKGNVQIRENSTGTVTEVIANSSNSACKSSEIAVNAGTYYIYSSGASAAIYGLRFEQITVPDVSGLGVDDGATLSSIPLSWTIPGICDLSKPVKATMSEVNSNTQETPVYNPSDSTVTAVGSAGYCNQYGIAFSIPEETNVTSVTADWKINSGNLGLFAAIINPSDGKTYWEHNNYYYENDIWNRSTYTINSKYWTDGGGGYSLPTSVQYVGVFANDPGYGGFTNESFSLRDLRYHVSGQNDIDHVVLMRKEGSAATGIADASATKLYEGTKSHYTDVSDVTGKNYYYTVFAVHASGAVSTGVSTSLTLYTITYRAGAHGTGTVAAGKKTHGINFTLSSSTFTRDGYTQDGWSTSDGEAKVYELGATYSIDAALTLYPHWVAVSGPVITNGNPSNGSIAITSDGSTPILSAVTGSTVYIAATPSTGYNFTSWDVYKTDDASTKVSTAAATASTTFEMPAYAVTVNASFTAKTYTVTLNGNGGSGNTANVTATYGSSSFSSSITNPTKTGYIFDGWYSGEDGTGSLIISTSGVLQASVSGYTGAGGIWTKDATTTLYAKWTRDVDQAKWGTGYNAFPDNSSDKRKNVTVTTSDTTHQSGDIFSGNQYYNFGDGDYLDINLDEGYEITDIKTCSYNDPWRAKDGITCNNNDGCEDVDTKLYINFSSAYTYSSSAKLNNEPILLTPNTYGSWTIVTYKNTLASIPEGAKSARIFADGSYDFGADLFYLEVERTALDCTPSTVTFAAGGGTGTAPSSRKECGEMTLPGKGSLAKKGNTFTGWSDGTSTYKEGDTYDVTGDVTFTAQWSPFVVPVVTGLEIGDDYALTWSIPGKLNLSTATLSDEENYFIKYQTPAGSQSYNAATEELTITYTAAADYQKGVAIPFTGNNLESITYDYKGHRVFPAVVKSADETLYWEYDVVTTSADWTRVTRTPSTIYPKEGTVKPLPTAKAITFCANPNASKTDEPFYIRNVFYHCTGMIDVDHVVLMRKEGSAATDTTEAGTATRLYSGKLSHYTDETAVAGKAYYYTVFSVHADGSVSAGTTVEKAVYIVTHSATSNGSYTIKVGDASATDETTTANYGQTITLSATPSSGYVFDHWTTSGTSVTLGNANVESTTFTMPEGNVTIAAVFKATPNVYYYKDGDHYSAGTYKNPEGNTASGENNVSFTDNPWTILQSVPGVTSVVVNDGTYDNKSNHVNAYIKLQTGGDASDNNIVFTIAEGYEATISMKIGGYSSNPTVTLKPYDGESLGSDITKTTGYATVSGVATTENNFNEIRWSDLEAGDYVLNVTTKTAYISEIDIQTEQVGYTVSFAVDGGSTGYGTVSPSSITEVTHGSTVSISENVLTLKETAVTATPTAESDEYTYAFDSWSVSDGASITSAQTITASFTRTAKEYTLTWDLNGGKVSTAGTAAAVDETEPSGSVAYNTALTAPVVTKNGYDFAGWTPSVADNMPAANTTYTATWAERFTVTYNAMTGSVDPTSATGSTANKVSLPEPTKDGYDFDGWYNTAGEKIGDAGDKYGPTAAITLYAKWKGSCASGDPVLFKQNINSATAVAFVDKAAITYSTANTLSGLVGSGDDLFTSISYNGSKTGGIAINSASGANSHSASGVIQAYKRDNGAYWSITRTTDFAGTAPTALKVEMDIWFDNTNSGSNYIGPCFAIGDGFSDGLNSTSAQSTSNVHSGFCITDESTPKIANYSDGSTKLYDTGLTESTWLSIAWIINNTGSDLTYDDPDGDGTTTLANDKFDIWLKTQAGAASTYTKVVSAASAITGTKDLQNIHIGGHGGKQHEFMLDNVKVTDLNATPCYQVTYHGNNATSGYVNDPAQYAENADPYVKYNTNGYERTGYEFVGWNTAANGSGTPYAEGAQITDIADDVNLYAQWRILIEGTNADFAGYTSVTSADDVRLAEGATLTIKSTRTIHDIILETGSTLNVNTTNGDGTGDGVTLTVHSLSLKGGLNSSCTAYDMPRVYINSKSSLEKSESTVNFDISVDQRNYYPIAVPFPVEVAEVDYVNSTMATYSIYGKHFVIKEYDGASRAENGAIDDNWVVVSNTAGTKLLPGKGYILTAISKPAYGGGVIRFPMSFTDAWTTKGEQATVSAVTKNTVAVEAYEGTATEGGKNSNKGWNMLGVPYMSCFDASDASTSPSDAFIKGKLNFITGEYTDAENVYVSVPTSDFSEYIQKPVSEAVLLPGWCFFVQVSENATVSFAAAGQEDDSSLPIYAPKREQAMPTVKTGIILSSETASDKTTILVSDKYSVTDYEINADLEKMFGNGYTLATYSLAGTTRLAYNAMSNSDATNVIPIGYRAPADGEYTFAINPRYAENGAFEHVNLIDYETGFVADLLVSNYTFATERTQNDERFAINVVKRQDVITDIGNGEEVNGERTNGVQKVIINDKLYIIVDGRMYDAKGAMVK